MRRFLRSSRHPAVRWWWSLDRLSLLVIFLLVMAGLVFVTTASSGVARTYDVDPNYFARRQIIFMLGAIPLMLAMTCLNTKMLKYLSGALFALSLLGVTATLFVGTDVKGATRWIDFGLFTLQPSELLKPAFVVLVAMLLAPTEPTQRMRGIKLSLALLALVVSQLFLQPDFGTSIVFCAVWGAMLFLSGMSLWLVVPLGGLGAALAGAGYWLLPHVRSRIDRFLNPENADTYQVDRAHEAFLSGGIFGRGPGEGVVKHVLPDAHTDFIFAVIGEEFGIFTCSLLLLAYVILIFRSFSRLLEAEDRFTLLAGSGLLLLLSMQVLVNVGVALHMFPTKGMTLPLISYGGSSTLAVAILLGFILSLTRKGAEGGVISRKYR